MVLYLYGLYYRTMLILNVFKQDVSFLFQITAEFSIECFFLKIATNAFAVFDVDKCKSSKSIVARYEGADAG